MRVVSLPPSVEGVTVPNDDGTFDIYINSQLSMEDQRRKMLHELVHIKRGDFYAEARSIAEMERAAKEAG